MPPGCNTMIYAPGGIARTSLSRRAWLARLPAPGSLAMRFDYSRASRRLRRSVQQ